VRVVGSRLPKNGTMRIPEIAANPTPMAHDAAEMRSESTPVSSAISGRSTTARIRTPSRVYRRKPRSRTQSAPVISTAAICSPVARKLPAVKTCLEKMLVGVRVVAAPHIRPASPCSATSSPMVTTIFTTSPARRRCRNSSR
jgi:hypothetical protein